MSARLPLAAIEEALESLIGAQEVVPVLNEALRYSLFPAGKRVRPLLAVELCLDLGGSIASALNPALALELLHTASLIHDDMPALDNDDLRRGRPTVHKKFGEGVALLAGDYLVALAFRLASEQGLPLEAKEKGLTSLGTAFMNLCHGQVRDILPAEHRGELGLIHSLKTGALFSSALEIGALASGANQEIRSVAKDLGLNMGLCFQIIDDYLDVYGPEGGIMEDPGSDARKVTFFSNHSKLEGIASMRRSITLVDDQFLKLESLAGRPCNRTRNTWNYSHHLDLAKDAVAQH